jgi:hypothetical protein
LPGIITSTSEQTTTGKKKKLFSFHPGKNPAASDNFDGFIVRQLAELRQPKGGGGREGK